MDQVQSHVINRKDSWNVYDMLFSCDTIIILAEKYASSECWMFAFIHVEQPYIFFENNCLLNEYVL